MTRARCPNCGGLVSADATWCGQCLTPLGGASSAGRVPGTPETTGSPVPPSAPSPAARPTASGSGDGRSGPAGSSRPIRAGEQGVVWECPTCQTENPIEATICRTCGTRFARLFEEEPPRATVERRRAVALSLLFPGLGHAAAGHRAEGVARAVVFAYSLITVVTILVSRSGEGLGPFLALVLLTGAAGLALYALTAIDAGRLTRGEPPIVSTRALLYGAVALILIAVVMLLVLGVRTEGTGG